MKGRPVGDLGAEKTSVNFRKIGDPHRSRGLMRFQVRDLSPGMPRSSLALRLPGYVDTEMVRALRIKLAHMFSLGYSSPNRRPSRTDLAQCLECDPDPKSVGDRAYR
jgi:hypothetical protein